MSEQQEKIVVLRSYGTVVEANLAKTKLDAYGIPCFLSDENFVGLYPIYNDIFPGVRLHIFEKDTEQANEILAENPLERNCPYCNSNNISREVTEENKPMKIITAITSGILFPDRMVFKCADCLREFDYPNYDSLI